MRLVIIADDACICIDGECYRGVDLSPLPSDVHAVQWHGEYGEVEYKSFQIDGTTERAPNQPLADIENFAWAIQRFHAAKSEAKTLAEEATTKTVAGENQPTAFGTQAL